MPLELAFAVFIKFYTLDPLDMTWDRFESLYRNIGNVQDEFVPKSKEQIMLMEKQAKIEQWNREHPK